MEIKFDIKTILILILLGFVIFFGLKWYFTYDNNKVYKKELKELKKQYKTLNSERDLLNDKIIDLESDYNKILKEDDKLKDRISSLENDIIDAKNKVSSSNKELYKIIEKNKEYKKRIDDLLSIPNDKSDEELIISLKNKLEK